MLNSFDPLVQRRTAKLYLTMLDTEEGGKNKERESPIHFFILMHQFGFIWKCHKT